MTRFTGPLIRRDTSQGVHVRALHVALWGILDALGDSPDNAHKRVAVRNHIAALRRAYPQHLDVNDVELEQWLQELDGIPQDDAL